MSPDEPPRSLEERVTRLEARAENRLAVVAALLTGAVIVWYLLQLGVLKPGAPGA